MEMIRCDNGHLFDANRFQNCPVCGSMHRKNDVVPDSSQDNLFSQSLGIAELPPGTLLGRRYLLQKVVAQGTFGIVYSAWDTKLEYVVGIKEFFCRDLMWRDSGGVEVIIGQKSIEETESRKQRFLAEARTMAKLSNHSNTADVFNYFEENGTAYIVMELLEGETLVEHMKKCGGKVDIDFAFSVANGVGNALATLHSNGIIHRGVTPYNIFVCTNGEHSIKLLDLGAAKLENAEDGEKDALIFPGFSPPEEYVHPEKVTPAIDIYGLGATLYQMLTGVKLEDAISRMLNDTAIPPNWINPSIPIKFSNAIMKATDLDLRHRFKTVEDFLADLREARNNEIERGSFTANIPTLFLSYCSKDECIADLIESTLDVESRHRIKISRYTRLPYRDSFREFMNTIQEHDYVFCVVSDSYLKSQACMYEVGEIVKDHKYKEKLFFVVLSENDRKYYPNGYTGAVAANIYGGAINRLNYTEYWKHKYDELSDRIDSLNDKEASTKATEKLKEIGRIYRNDINEFLAFLTDYNGKSFELLYSNRFIDVINLVFADRYAIGEKSVELPLKIKSAETPKMEYTQDQESARKGHPQKDVWQRAEKYLLEAPNKPLSNLLICNEDRHEASTEFKKLYLETVLGKSSNSSDNLDSTSEQNQNGRHYWLFGRYPQGTNGEMAPILWRELDRDGNTILLVSRFVLDAKPYNDEWKAVTWAECSLRFWLNGNRETDFSQIAFTPEEWNRIQAKSILADNNPLFDTNPGAQTEDKVFLLSIQEVDRGDWFSSEEDRRCVPTNYVKKNVWISDKFISDDAATCLWWLRSPGGYSHNAAIVNHDGTLGRIGLNVHSSWVGVRPAIWVNLEPNETNQ